MPRTLPPELIDYGWAGIRIGTKETYVAQGFAYNFGIITMYGYNATLTVYYALAIAFRMRDDRIVKYFEPLLHLFPILVGLGIAVPPLLFIEEDMVYKPSLNTWCSIAPNFRSDTSQAEDEEELFVNKYYDLQSRIIISSYLSILLLEGNAQEFVLFSRISVLNYDTDRRVMELELIDETNHAGYYSIKDDGPQQGSVIEAMVGENEEEKDNLDDFDLMLSLSKSKVDQEESCGSVSTKLGKLVAVESLSSDQISILKSEEE